MFYAGGHQLDSKTLALFVAASGASLLGLLDDLKGLSSRTRLLGYSILSLGFMSFVRYSETMAQADETTTLTGLVFLTSALWITWGINFFNFMDGINGIAAVQALVSFGAYALYNDLSSSGLFALLIVSFAATAGFLPSNFPKARIFMGDSGSVLLGFLSVGAPLLFTSGKTEFSLLLRWASLAPFFFDSTATLIRRVYLGEKWTDGHNTHSYQILAKKWGSHVGVTALYGAGAILCSTWQLIGEVGIKQRWLFIMCSFFGAVFCIWLIKLQLDLVWKTRWQKKAVGQ